MSRVTPTDVTELLPAVDSGVSLAPFISIATILVDKVAAADTEGDLGAAQLAKIEALIAAHAYVSLRDKQYTSKRTGDASATFQGQYGKKLESTDFGQLAMMLDTTGFLEDLNAGSITVGMDWLGTDEDSPRPDYERQTE